MARASVARVAVQVGISMCETSVHELESASRCLQQCYQAAGTDWRDEKYAQLGGIVEECCSELMRPVSELNESIRTLKQILGIIDEYESVSF